MNKINSYSTNCHERIRSDVRSRSLFH